MVIGWELSYGLVLRVPNIVSPCFIEIAEFSERQNGQRQSAQGCPPPRGPSPAFVMLCDEPSSVDCLPCPTKLKGDVCCGRCVLLDFYMMPVGCS